MRCHTVARRLRQEPMSERVTHRAAACGLPLRQAPQNLLAESFQDRYSAGVAPMFNVAANF